jgi:hypothetical protein
MLLIVDVMSSLHTHMDMDMDMNKSGMMPSVESMTEPQLSMHSLSRNDEQQSMLFNQTQEGMISQELQARVDKLEKGLINANQLLQPTTANTSNRSSTSHKELPTCELLMKRPDSPVADGTFLSRSTTPTTWTLRAAPPLGPFERMDRVNWESRLPGASSVILCRKPNNVCPIATCPSLGTLFLDINISAQFGTFC